MHATPTRIRKRPADDRGRADHGWLQARFSFSFAGYVDPDYMGFRSLRVINNDTLQAGGGFPTHPHDNMEIFTYVIEGQLAHRDSMGNGAVIGAGNLQYMSAGKGIRHSEFNPSDTHKTHLYQVWLQPNVKGGEPRYMEKPLAELARPNDLTLLYSGDGRDGSTEIRQDADIYFGHTESSDTAARRTLALPASTSMPYAWIQVISGAVSVLGESLGVADGLAMEQVPESIDIKASPDSTFLVFRLA